MSETRESLNGPAGSKMLLHRPGPHKHVLKPLPTNHKAQAAVYGSVVLFFAWLWGSILYSLIGVGAVLALAHSLALFSLYKDGLENKRVLEYLRTHPARERNVAEGAVQNVTVDTAEILKDL